MRKPRESASLLDPRVQCLRELFGHGILAIRDLAQSFLNRRAQTGVASRGHDLRLRDGIVEPFDELTHDFALLHFLHGPSQSEWRASPGGARPTEGPRAMGHRPEA